MIPFHHEMAQVPNPPAYVFFFCDIPSEVGGATSIVHSGKVCEAFEQVAPEFAKHVEESGVRYVRVMPEEDDPTSPIGRSWKNTFQVQTREQAEERMKSLGTDWEWLSEGNLKTITRVVPAIRTDERTGLKVFFNSMVAAYTGWTDQRNDGETAVVCGDGAPVKGDALLRTQEVMDEESVSIPWQQGDMLWVDNGLVMHARQPYEGQRRILASIAVIEGGEMRRKSQIALVMIGIWLTGSALAALSCSPPVESGELRGVHYGSGSSRKRYVSAGTGFVHQCGLRE